MENTIFAAQEAPAVFPAKLRGRAVPPRWYDKQPFSYNAISRATRAIATDGGCTTHVHDMFTPKQGYVCSVLPKEQEHGVLASHFYLGETGAASFTRGATELKAFCQKHAQMLARTDHFLGAWEEKGIVYLDVVRIFTPTPQGKAAALRLGRRNTQTAIYDMTAGESIYL